MKKSLFWSLIAATAMMTACGDDAFENNQQVVTGEETPVAFKINMGNAISTYAGTDFSKGGWSNWKESETGMSGVVNARATLQVFANGGTSPYAQVRKVLSEPDGDEIVLPNFRLAAGNSYTAVVWVDFVPKSTETSTTEVRNDYYWSTENLAKVSELKFTEDGLMPVVETPEARDAYTGLINFTVNADGTYNMENKENQAKTTVIPITATRKFAKISLILTDYDNKTEWTDALNNLGEDNILEYLGMQVTNLSTGYNALTQAPIAAKPTTQSYFHRSFDVASATNSSDNVNGVKWYEKDGKSYPIFDLNYVIPASAGKEATYSLSFKGYNRHEDDAFTADAAALTEINAEANGFKLVAIRNASSVPVRTNAHTIIKMNLYKAYSCTVTVVDGFTGGTEDVTINDDDTKVSTDNHYIPEGDASGAHIVVERDNEGYATSINITNVSEKNFDLVVKDIVAMKNLASVDINISGSKLPNPADFSALKTADVTNKINLTLTEAGQAVVLEGLANNIDLTLPTGITTLGVTSTADVTITAAGVAGATSITANNVTITDITTADAATIAIKGNATFNNGTYGGDVTVSSEEENAAATIANGTFNNNFNSNVNTTVDDGTLDKTQDGGTGLYNHKLIMSNGKTLTINKSDAAFGPLFTNQGSDCKLVYASKEIKAFYSGMEGSNWASILPTDDNDD